MNYLRLLVVAAALSLPGAPIYATTAPAPVEASAPAETAEHFLASLKQQTGTVTLPGGIVRSSSTTSSITWTPTTPSLLHRAGATRRASQLA